MSEKSDWPPKAPEIRQGFDRTAKDQPATEEPKKPEKAVTEDIQRHRPGRVLRPGGSMGKMADSVDKNVRQEVARDRQQSRRKDRPTSPKIDTKNNFNVASTNDKHKNDNGRNR